MGANMRGVALICSALFLLTAGADAQPRLKRDDTAAPVAAPSTAAAPKKEKGSPRGAAKQEPAKPAPVVDTRPRLRRDDTPAPATATAPAAPAATPQKGKRHSHTATKPQGKEQPESAAQKSAKATVRDIGLCSQTKQADAAIEGCTKVVDDAKQKPKARAAAYFNRGNALLQKGDHDKAITDFDEALKLDPKNASAYNNRGNAKNEKGDADGAVEDFNAAIKQNARYAAAYFNRGNALAAKGEAKRALKDYDTAIKYNKRNVNAYIARGALLLADGSIAKARADMKTATGLDRKNAYTVLWHDIAERRAKQKGVLTGPAATKGLDMKAWPAPVVQLFIGEIKQDAVLAAADNADATLKQAHTCEANFYGGEYALISGAREDAVKLFEAAAKDCPHGFLEGIAANAELKGLGQKVGAN
jgi:lipoprotein NlpI